MCQVIDHSNPYKFAEEVEKLLAMMNVRDGCLVSDHIEHSFEHNLEYQSLSPPSFDLYQNGIGGDDSEFLCVELKKCRHNLYSGPHCRV